MFDFCNRPRAPKATVNAKLAKMIQEVDAILESSESESEEDSGSEADNGDNDDD